MFLLWTRLHFFLRGGGGGGRLCVSRKHCLRSLSSLLPSAHYATAPEKTGKEREGSSLLPFSLCNSLGKVARILLSFPTFLCAFQKRTKARKTHFSQTIYKLSLATKRTRAFVSKTTKRATRPFHSKTPFPLSSSLKRERVLGQFVLISGAFCSPPQLSLPCLSERDTPNPTLPIRRLPPPPPLPPMGVGAEQVE